VSSPEEIARNEHAPVTRAEAPVSGISVPAHLAVGTDLVDGIDYVVWLQVMYDTASGRTVSPIQTWKRLQERGIRSTKNRAELVGKNTVYESYARIIEAGYFERYEVPNEKHPGRKGPIGYRVYDNPAWNPTWQARQVGSDPLRDSSAKSQVGMLPGTGDDSTHDRTQDEKTAGQNASRNQGSGVPGSGVPGSGKRRVPAGRNASPVPGAPPHPLGGGGTTPPPNPLTHTDGAQQHPSQPEEGGVFDQKDLEAATAFLQQLPDPWVIGEKDARQMAPELLASMESKGWPQFADVDQKTLASCLATNHGGANNLPSILRRKRIPNLPAFSRVASRAAARSNTPAEGMCERHPGFRVDDCSPCRKAEMGRSQRGASDLAPVDGAALLASLLQKNAD
jgi:hypothetical protein